jgi:hypothetical protein
MPSGLPVLGCTAAGIDPEKSLTGTAVAQEVVDLTVFSAVMYWEMCIVRTLGGPSTERSKAKAESMVFSVHALRAATCLLPLIVMCFTARQVLPDC